MPAKTKGIRFKVGDYISRRSSMMEEDTFYGKVVLINKEKVILCVTGSCNCSFTPWEDWELKGIKKVPEAEVVLLKFAGKILEGKYGSLSV